LTIAVAGHAYLHPDGGLLESRNDLKGSETGQRLNPFRRAVHPRTDIAETEAKIIHKPKRA
jgi:hypothetical protein